MPFLARNVLNSSGSSTVPACVGVAGSVFGVAEGEGLGGAAGGSLALVLGVGLGVGLGDAVAEVVGVEDKEGLAEGDGEASGDELKDGEGEELGDCDGVELGEGGGVRAVVAFGDGVVTALGIAMPLFQVSFLPFFMQVNFLPLKTAVLPALLHVAPALGLAAAPTGLLLIGASNADVSAIAMKVRWRFNYLTLK